MRELVIDLEELAMVMEDHDRMSEWYLDTREGKIECIPSELSSPEFHDEDEGADLPDWEKELVPIVEAIEAGNDRYVPVPEIPSREEYDLMERFAETVSDPALRRLLDVALDGKGAFRRFKDVLYDYPEEQDRWFKYRNAAMEEHVREWLDEIGIEPVAKS